MFSDYELSEFSTKLLEIRKNLGYSRESVSLLTGINVDTIRKIEKGVSIPRFETLEILSFLYKIDLLQLLNNYKNNNTITYFYESLNHYLISNNIPSFFELHSNFKNWLKFQNKYTLINRLELIQLEFFFDAIYHKFSVPNYSLDDVIDELVVALKVSIPSFNFNSWMQGNYNLFELRIIYCIASMLLQNGDYNLSNNILIYLLERVDLVSYSKQSSDIMSIKLYSLIAYNHHMLDKHDEVLKVAEKGIALCQKTGMMDNLPLLLSRKGVALFYLRKDDFALYLNQAIVLLEIQGNFELANKYKLVNEKYIRMDNV